KALAARPRAAAPASRHPPLAPPERVLQQWLAEEGVSLRLRRSKRAQEQPAPASRGLTVKAARAARLRSGAQAKVAQRVLPRLPNACSMCIAVMSVVRFATRKHSAVWLA